MEGAALLLLLNAVAGGSTLETALASLSFTQWAGIGFAALRAAPEVLTAIRALHPALERFLTDIHANGVLPADAAVNVMDWMKQNNIAAIKQSELVDELGRH